MCQARIITTHVYPPIPVRHCDWSAHYAGEEDEQMATGRGRTEQEAVDDLVENHPRELPHAPGGLREQLHELFG